MSKKHEKRTRAEILAKREQPIVEIPVHRMIGPVVGPIVPFKRVQSRSKYTPHFGAKQQAKLLKSSVKSDYLRDLLTA